MKRLLNPFVLPLLVLAELILILFATIALACSNQTDTPNAADSCFDTMQLARMSGPMLGAGASAATGCVISGCSGAPSCTGSTGCAKRETFEGTTSCVGGFDSSCDGAWIYANANIDFTYTPALQGSNSMSVDAGGSTKAFLNIGDLSTAYVGAIISVSEVNYIPNFRLQREVDAPACLAYAASSTTVCAISDGGTEQCQSGLSLSAGTFYWKIKAVKGTGSNAECTLYFSTNGTSWTNGPSSTNGTWTANVTVFNVENIVGLEVIDDIRSSSSDFNYW